MLKGQGIREPKAAAHIARGILDEHPGWAYNAGLERNVRLELYKVLTPPLPKTAAIRDETSEMQAEAQRASALTPACGSSSRLDCAGCHSRHPSRRLTG